MKTDLNSLMGERGLDALAVFGNAEYNPPMYYLTGGGHVSHATLIWKRGSEPVLFHGDMERDEAARSGLKLISYSKFNYPDLVRQSGGDLRRAVALRLKLMFEELGLAAGRVGVYGNYDVSSVYAMLTEMKQEMPGIEFVGEVREDSILMRAMETKDEGEVARIRGVGAITTAVVAKVREFLTSRDVNSDEVLLNEDRSILTVGDVHARIRLWIAERGAELPSGFIFAIGRDSGVPHSGGNPADPMRLGQTIVFDLYPAEPGGGYYYDFTRTWSLGYAAPRAQQLYDQVHEIYFKLLDEFDLNTAFKEYNRLTCDYFESKGHATPLNADAPLDGYVHSLGHGVGLNIHERPFSSPLVNDDHRLKAGVVITSEPGLYYPELGMGVRIEDTLWVRPDGKMEMLAEFPYDFVLPMKKWKKS